MTDAFVAGLPKAELHVHLEGTLEPDLAFACARRNGVAPPAATPDTLRAAFHFTRLQDFLDLYYACAATLVTARDFHDLTAAYLARAHRDGVRHVELFVDPQTHSARGVAVATVFEGIQRALDAARAATGMTGALIPCFLRHLSEDAALATLDAILPFRPLVVGVGLDSSERGYPPARFARVFARARAAGLHVVAHAGEEGPPAYVRQALDVLGAERIDHGVRAVEDPALVGRLAREEIPLTVCPLSNLRLGVVPSLAAHPLARLLDAGVAVTINSDDPAYFGGYVADNYVAAAHALGLGRPAIHRLAANSLRAAFLPEKTGLALLATLDAQAAPG